MREPRLKLSPADGLLDIDRTILDELKNVTFKRRYGDWDNHCPIVKVRIPSSVVIDCPKLKSHLSYGRACEQCEHFKGIVQIAWNDEESIPWHGRYAIRCAFVIERKTNMLVIEP